jgi:methylated-DNA-[protein]-cysteine S-methyltransferase
MWTVMPSPVGDLRIVERDGSIVAIEFSPFLPPSGETASYGEIAGRLGMTNAASRAVGLANGRNPIPIVVPCHRVIGANGTLTGYAGGLERKQQLLELEQDALF